VDGVCYGEVSVRHGVERLGIEFYRRTHGIQCTKGFRNVGGTRGALKLKAH